MIATSGRTFLYRGIARFASPEDRSSMIGYLSGIKGKAVPFDNQEVPNTLIVDFEDQPERDEFNKRYGAYHVVN